VPKYNKLVRDLIPEIIKENGETPITRILGDEEYKQELIKKLGEEYQEFCDDPNEEELADIKEVINALESIISTHEKVERVRIEKAQKRGSFDKKIFLERTE
jgi:predicted house-cleaning noncanonical NTP pyrophosphatase (MazG superfamily)